MSKPKTTGKPTRTGTSIRLPDDLRARLDAIAAADEARLGFRPNPADALRGCLAIGIAAREVELGLAPSKKAKP